MELRARSTRRPGAFSKKEASLPVELKLIPGWSRRVSSCFQGIPKTQPSFVRSTVWDSPATRQPDLRPTQEPGLVRFGKLWE